MTIPYLILGIFGWVFFIAIYAISVDANITEQRARMECNNRFRSSGLEPIYTIDLKIIRNVDK